MSTGTKIADDKSDIVRAFLLELDGDEFFVVSLQLERRRLIPLTRAELEVARALARGASNAEIAQARGTSIRTIANQVASILRRLGAKSRAHAAIKLALFELALE